jgi:CHAD domain-containing protein
MLPNQVILSKSFTNYLIPIEKNQDYFKELETRYKKQTNPFKKLAVKNRINVNGSSSKCKDSKISRLMKNISQAICFIKILCRGEITRLRNRFKDKSNLAIST